MNFCSTDDNQQHHEAGILHRFQKVPQFITENAQQQQMKHRMNVYDPPHIGYNKEPSRLHDVVLPFELSGCHVVLLEDILVIRDVAVPCG